MFNPTTNIMCLSYTRNLIHCFYVLYCYLFCIVYIILYLVNHCYILMSLHFIFVDIYSLLVVLRRLLKPLWPGDVSTCNFSCFRWLPLRQSYHISFFIFMIKEQLKMNLKKIRFGRNHTIIVKETLIQPKISLYCQFNYLYLL